MSAEKILTDRTARRRAALADAPCPAAILASLPPLSANRRVRLCGRATAAEILAFGANRIVVDDMRAHGTIAPCPGCGRRTRKAAGHRDDCTAR